MPISDDFLSLLPRQAEVEEETWKGPVYCLWVFDPMTDRVTVDHNKGRHRAKAVTHSDMCPEVLHPGRLNGYANKIQGGWRITTDDHKLVEDPHVIKKVRESLRQAFPPKALPNAAH